ncbi:MAG TPA: hypothetical protein VFS35_02505 [Terrimicrobiaceae bacterium]|nr:hypothetical protein [Terrimicrobiaceae bacterium]
MAYGGSVVPYDLTIGSSTVILVQSAIVSGKDIGFEETGGQGCGGEGKRHCFIEPDLAVVPMKTRQTALHRVRLGPKFLVS